MNTAQAKDDLVGAFHPRKLAADVISPRGFHFLLSDEGSMPNLDGAIGWLNSTPLSSKSLRGKVVLVNFWTYTCINSLRPLDFRLSPDTVRSPDVAFVTMEHLRRIDINRSPVEGASALAIEVISPSNLAQDTLKKVSQYLGAGSSAVWLVYPGLGIVEVHKPGGIGQIKVPDSLTEEGIFGGRRFTLALTPLFTDPRGQP